MKSAFKILMGVVGLLLIASCLNEPETEINEVRPGFETFKDSLYKNYKADVLRQNKALLYALFDSVAYKSIDLVLRDRVYPTNTKRIPDLKNASLDDMGKTLIDNGQDIDSIKKYIQKFIDLREEFLKKNSPSGAVFTKVERTILTSDVYKKNILKKKDTFPEYLNLNKKIKRIIENAQARYENNIIKSKWVEKESASIENSFKNYEKSQKKAVQDSSSILKNNSLLLFVLLIISLLTNLVLGVLFFRNRKKIEKAAVQESAIVLKKEQTPVLPISLTQLEVSNYISQTLKKLQTDLAAKYHNDCVETQIKELQSFESVVFGKSKSKQFKDKYELEQFVSPMVKKHHDQITQKLDEIIDKYTAQQQLERELPAKNFVLKYSSSIISAEDVQSKIALLKKRYFEEMPKTISKNELKAHIDDLRESLKIAIEKMIKENSQLYFPYADAQGILSDDKKSKEKERDSAIRLTLDPKDNTRATFQLLYEYSDMMQAGIQSYDILLLPICDLKSEDFNRSGTKIFQNGRDGEMILENGKWQLKTKLAIKIT